MKIIENLNFAIWKKVFLNSVGQPQLPTPSPHSSMLIRVTTKSIFLNSLPKNRIQTWCLPDQVLNDEILWIRRTRPIRLLHFQEILNPCNYFPCLTLKNLSQVKVYSTLRYKLEYHGLEKYWEFYIMTLLMKWSNFKMSLISWSIIQRNFMQNWFTVGHSCSCINLSFKGLTCLEYWNMLSKSLQS